MRIGRRRAVPVATVLYATALLASNAWLEAAPAATEARVLQAVSSNLWHLTRDPWLVVPASAFFTRGGVPYAVLGCLVCVGILELVAGTRQTVLVGVSGHVVGTLVSEAVIAIRVAAGDLPESARRVLDVGPSYVLVACAAAVLAWPGAGGRARAACALALAPVFVFTAWRLPAGRVDAMGHVTAAAVGLVWAGLGRRRAGTTREEVVT